MSFHGGGIDQQLGGWALSGCQGMKQLRPHALRGPALEPVVQRLARTIDRWRVFPTTTRQQHMHDAADHAPVVNPRPASCVCRQMRLKPFELHIVQPELPLIHQPSPFGDLESGFGHREKPLYGSPP